jgi:conjugative relaxase-like TrwC/TraI family protein
VRLAVGQLEEAACYTRMGHHSATTGEWRDGNGLIAALFTHHISRDGDPQLHVHVAIANIVQRADGADGAWRALDGTQLFQLKLSVAVPR